MCSSKLLRDNQARYWFQILLDFIFKKNISLCRKTALTRSTFAAELENIS